MFKYLGLCQFLKIKSQSRGTATLLLIVLILAFSSAIFLGGYYLGDKLGFSLNKFKLGSSQEKPSQAVSQPTPTSFQPKLQGAIALKEGSVGRRKDDGSWEELKKGASVKEGDVIRSGYKSRAVIELDDGSALRLDQNSELALTAVGSEVIMISQNNGRVYHRVHPGKIVYNVKSLNTVATALGTSFTVNTDTKQQKTEVAVFENKVALTTTAESSAKTEIKQGEVAVVGNDQKVALAEIPQQKIKEDFIKWNQSLDKEPTLTLKLTTVPTKTESTPQPTKTTSLPTNNSFNLTVQAKEGAVQLSWSGIDSPGGFKIVKSTNANPTYPENDWKYVGASDRSFTWSGLSANTAYHFRVGVYNEGKITSYSNDLTVTPLAVTSLGTSNAGSDIRLNLTVTSNNPGTANLSWTVDGRQSKNGFKYVYSKEPNPTYPNNTWYYEPSSEIRSYEWKGLPSGEILHFRAGAYEEGKVTSYSNDVTVTIK